MSNPDPKCPDCKETGQITLLTSSCECDCVSRKPIVEMKILDKIDMKIFEKCYKKYSYPIKG